MSFGPPTWRPLALLIVGLAAVAGAFLVPPVGAFAAVVLLAAARDWWCQPALELTPSGFRYVAGLHRESVGWEAVDAVRVRHERHWLAFGRNLEIDLRDETLIVLSNLQLGRDPDEVAAAVERAWHTATA